MTLKLGRKSIQSRLWRFDSGLFGGAGGRGCWVAFRFRQTTSVPRKMTRLKESFVDAENCNSRHTLFRIQRLSANPIAFGITVAVCGTGPARPASSKCHDFTVDHGLSSGVRGGSTGKKKKKIVSYIAVRSGNFAQACLRQQLKEFCTLSIASEANGRRSVTSLVSVGVLEFFIHWASVS